MLATYRMGWVEAMSVVARKNIDPDAWGSVILSRVMAWGDAFVIRTTSAVSPLAALAVMVAREKSTRGADTIPAGAQVTGRMVNATTSSVDRNARVTTTSARLSGHRVSGGRSGRGVTQVGPVNDV